ncbi:MAG: retrotransposon gag domain-containing protein, partial [Verrucomicrobia bacterium]|nr:retrotransposon gag domain-containing protein [Verrucomicrobiota bacterium]
EGKGDWEQFLALFNARFLPEPVLRQKEEEFNKLLQGSKTVWEYHAEFMTLARYAPHLLNDEVRLARKFRDGLRFEIIRRIGGVPVDTVAKIVEVA